MGTIDLGTAAAAGVKSMELEATITRADGTVEHLGVIARTKRPGFFRRIFGKA